MTEEKSLKDEVKELKEVFQDLSPGAKKKIRKQKKFRLPFKARINKARLNKGYVTVEVIDDNKNISFTREPIIDGTIKLRDTFHAVKDLDVFIYKGKPFIHQPKKKINPYNPLAGVHETYGQKYVMARMEGDKIISKRSIGGLGLSIIGLVIGALIIYALFTGG